MAPIEALKHIQVLLDAAAVSDDLDVVQKYIPKTQDIVKKAPPRKTRGTPAPGQ